MYCSNCGKKINKTDSYCKYCGNEIIKENVIIVEETSNLPMRWYNFFLYCRLPLGIITYLLYLPTLDFNTIMSDSYFIGIFVLFTLLAILCFVNIFTLYEKRKNGFYFIAFQLVVESIINIISNTDENSLLSLIINLIIQIVIWLIPNYIYFYKRKHFFVN